MSKLKTMTPITSALILSLATLAHAEPAKVPGKPASSVTKPAKPMEGKCGSGMKMGEAKRGAMPATQK